MSAANHNSLKGKFLLAEPSMQDPNFAYSLVLICEHDENQAIGLTINREIPKFLSEQIMEELGLMTEHTKEMPIFEGGPCQIERGFVLHTDDWLDASSVEIVGKIYLTATSEVLTAIAGGFGPKRVLFALGYAGWAAGQLEAEIAANSWLISDVDLDLVFEPMEMKEKWQRALGLIGIDPAKLTMISGNA